MSSDVFVSYAQNGEDVVLNRVFAGVTAGRYIDVGAHDPIELSVTKQLYDSGWSGLNLEPVAEPFKALCEARPRDVTLQLAAGQESGRQTFYVVPDTGLSTLREEVAGRHADDGRTVAPVEVAVETLDHLWEEHFAGEQVHVLKIDVEGAEQQVLGGLDLTRHRPWVLLIEATEPLSPIPTHDAWEPALLTAGYEFCMFDGVSRWYVASEHVELKGPLSYPACCLDLYLPLHQWQATYRSELFEQQAATWREEALTQAVTRQMHARELGELREQLAFQTWKRDTERARAEHAEWQLGLVEQERTWLRGVVEGLEQRAVATAHPARRLAGKLVRTVSRRATSAPS